MATDISRLTARFISPGIEIINPHIERGFIRHVLFDFDGTLSLIREGWQQVMVPMMVEILRQTPQAESEEEIHHVVTEFVERLTGKQTIYQMIQLCEEIRKRGGEPLSPVDYKHIYHERLWQRIEHRVAGLKSGKIPREDLLVPGSLELLNALKQRGCTLYLASGTDKHYVIDEARALGIADYFGEHIYGAVDEYWTFSKQMIIEKIIKDHHLRGREFAAFGDGYVEIENTKAVGGIAVGVASDEVRRCGINAWKRNRLIGAGADVIIGDFREWERLLEYLFLVKAC
ncbi:MAG: HAD family hydrolase [Abditibacteriales bacterium]|nr:HAD family hydrolase [Abditibacteriales bacterium]MDW8367374.1 HAD family hydrolase [Abditibacteriales bacterium]